MNTMNGYGVTGTPVQPYTQVNGQVIGIPANGCGGVTGIPIVPTPSRNEIIIGLIVFVVVIFIIIIIFALIFRGSSSSGTTDNCANVKVVRTKMA